MLQYLIKNQLIELLLQTNLKVMKTNTIFKFIIFLIISVLLKTTLTAQNFNGEDKAPHDISYYRENMVTKPLVKVLYGRPKKDGQDIFGNIVEYGKVWRTGANEATEVKFYQDILFGDTKVLAGTYVLLTIPGENEWEVILSSNVDVWGAFQYNPLFNVARITVPSKKAESVEIFSIAFKKKKDKINMILAWDSTRVKIPIAINIKEEYAKL